jgi:hypothetical protein
MPGKTRKVKKGNKLALVPFNLDTLNEIMSQNSVRCSEWQKNSEPNCSDNGTFYNGYERVFKKYKGIFDAKYKEIMETDVKEVVKKVPNIPNKKCKQIVLGAGEDIVLYIAINNKFMELGKPAPFTLFMPPTWDESGNLLFTQCAIDHQLNNCADDFFIRILLPKDMGRLLDKSKKARVCLLEICTVVKYARDWKLKAFIYKTPADCHYDIVFI